MYFRVSRLRFILPRCACLLLVVLFLFQIRTFLPSDISSRFNPIEDLYWQELQSHDQFLTNEQRIEQIESYDRQRRRSQLNWTNVFYEIYWRKIETLNQRDGKNPYKYRSTGNTQNFSQKIIEIFEETPVFQRPKFCSSTRIFHPQCPYTNCQWSCRKSPINGDNIRRASIFHHVDINNEEMSEKSKSRSSNDIWILWIDEANRQLEHLNPFQFNWTISFRQDSEISIATYGLIIPNHSQRTSPYSKNKSDLLLTSDFLDLFANRDIRITNSILENHIFTNYRFRSKHALWFVSNCQPKARIKYYQQLKTSFPIKAFGSCITDQENECNKNDHCELTQSRLALFYLAFESQTCQDYITEKFWRSLAYGMIPIVFGPAKQSYLDLGVPASAFIHASDFKSVKQLAIYLHQIANDYVLYRSYFQWLDHYEVFHQMNDLEPIRMCELCLRLNLQPNNDHRFYKDIHHWHRTGC